MKKICKQKRDSALCTIALLRTIKATRDNFAAAAAQGSTVRVIAGYARPKDHP